MPKLLVHVRNAAKNILRYANYGRVKTPVFVVGCQRSGTTMILAVLGRCPKVYSDQEGTGVILEKKYFRLISEDVVRSAISRTPEPIIMFKPLNDSQHLDRLLGLHPRSRAIWAYRHYLDVVNSALKLWGDAQRSIIYEVSSGQYSNLGREAISERVTPENLKLINLYVEKGISPEDGAALIWYLRNSIFFDLQLEANPKVTLCKYEGLVQEPERRFRELFEFVGAKYSPKYTGGVHARSVRKTSNIKIDPEIEALCGAMLSRLDAEYKRQEGVAAGTMKAT